MTARIQKWGNSQGLRLPKRLLEEINLLTGDDVEIIAENNQIIIKPIASIKNHFKIADLVASMPLEYNPTEEISDRMGIEEW